jgi:hypothetical protein
LEDDAFDDVTPSLTSYRSVYILSCSALVTLSPYLTSFLFRTICVLPARLYRTLWPAPPPIPVRTVCASVQATPAYSEYYSHTHTWPFRSSYSAVLWACMSQLASDLTHLFSHFTALIMRSYSIYALPSILGHYQARCISIFAC